MRVLAARFTDANRAQAVRDRLQRWFHVEEPDLGIAPLGTPDRESDSEILLAGRFPDEKAPEVAEIVRSEGGEIVANVDERWTRPRFDDQPPPERRTQNDIRFRRDALLI